MRVTKEGKIDTNYLLGDLYYFGHIVEKDISKAILYYEKSADAGNEDACIKLGDLFFYGDGVEKDIIKAILWYEKSKCTHEVMEKIGDLYYLYLKDTEKAIRYYEKAEKEGNIEASKKLGDLYFHGDGVKKDIKKAILYYEKSAEKFQHSSLMKLEGIYSFCDEIYNKVYEKFGDFQSKGEWDANTIISKIFLGY